MRCLLRAHGEGFDVTAFLSDSPLRPDEVYNKGDALEAGQDNGATRTASGFSLVLSRAGFDLEAQVREAIAFLDEYEDELRRLGSFPGVDAMSIDFGIAWREAAAQADVFPSDLLWRAGALDIWLAVTHYPVVDQTN